MAPAYDMIIIGGGPAGASAAFFSKYFDQDNAFRVLLIEKFPEKKFEVYHDMCGCCISKDAFSELSPIKPTHVIENINFIEEVIADAFTLKHKMKGFIVDRPAFQHGLINEFISMGGGVSKGAFD